MKHKILPNPIPKPTQSKKMTRFNSTPIPLCFRPSTTTPPLEYHQTPPSATAPATTSTPNLTTCLYQTHLGIFSLTWSRSLLSRSFHLHLHPPPSLSTPPLSLSSPTFHLTLKPFIFWNKSGDRKLPPPPQSLSPIHIFWDLNGAKFGPGTEPVSGFYIAVVFEGEMMLLIGDMEKEAYAKTKAKKKVGSGSSNNGEKMQSLVIRREHVFGNRFYNTATEFGGKSRSILIELNTSNEEDPRLVIRFDSKRVLQVKHLRWKFRGSERVEVDGYPIQLSWDVYNWLFEEDCGIHDDGYALFTFRFEKQGSGCSNSDVDNNKTLKECFDGGEGDESVGCGKEGNSGGKRGVIWSQDSCGLNYERKKMKKKLLVKRRSASSSSLSSVSSGSNSVLEWESVEENELKGPTGFSLLVYAWKS